MNWYENWNFGNWNLNLENRILEKDLEIGIYKEKVDFERLLHDGIFIKSHICIMKKKNNMLRSL